MDWPKEKRRMIRVIVMLLVGITAIMVPVLMQDYQANRDAEEYAALVQVYQPEQADELADETLVPDGNDEAPQLPSPGGGTSGPNFAALQATNKDFIAWLKIPGTKIIYPVVLTDKVEYYLTHTFAGKESKIGTLFSLGKTDYKTPSQNIAIYGHNIRGSGQNMFQPLISYKKKGFWENHSQISFNTLYHNGTYQVFAVINIKKGDWDPSTVDFADKAAFVGFVDRAVSQSLFDTGVKVKASDEILTLITCDRSYYGADGRLVVMAVKQ